MLRMIRTSIIGSALTVLLSGYGVAAQSCGGYSFSTTVATGEQSLADLEQISVQILGGNVQLCSASGDTSGNGAVLNTRPTAVSDGTYYWVDSNLQKNVLGYYLSFSQDDEPLLPYRPGAEDFVVQVRQPDPGQEAVNVKLNAQVHLKLNADLKPGRHQINALYLSDARYLGEDWQGKTADWGVFRIPTMTLVNNSLTCHVNDLDVTLPTLSTQVFRQPDDRAGTTPFEIEINCDNETAVEVSVTMIDAMDNTNKTSVLTNNGSAQGIGVAILDERRGFTALSEPWPLTIDASSAAVSYKLPLQAAYQRLGTARVSQGTVNAKSTVTVSYR